MSGTAIVQMSYGTETRAPGSTQTDSVRVWLFDSTGAQAGFQSIAAPNGVPAANSASFTGIAAGSGYTAAAQPYAGSSSNGSKLTSSPFSIVDGVPVTVVLGVTGAQG